VKRFIFSIFWGLSVFFLLQGCETPPVVTPMPNVAAVRQQNQQTIQHIKQTKIHIKKSQEREKKVDDHLKAVQSDIDQLLGMPSIK
jgi:septal ring factor EnvC (AmiA/AmiB activator)